MNISHMKRFLIFLVLVIVCVVVWLYGFRVSMINRLESSRSLQTTVAPDVAKKGKSLVVLFGIASRGLSNTWSQIHKKIIIPLEKSGYDVTVHIINNDIGDALIDGTSVNLDGFNALGFKSVDHYKQSDIDQSIYAHCKNKQRCAEYNESLKKDPILLNMRRQMFLEQKVADYLLAQKSDYDVTVVMNSELYPFISLDMSDIEKAKEYSSSFKKIGMSSQSDFHGYTNGFYLGDAESVALALSGYNDIDFLLTIDDARIGYEKQLYFWMKKVGVDRIKTSMHFCKMRASKCCMWQGHGNDVFSEQTEKNLKVIFQEARLLQKSGFGLSPGRHLRGVEKKYYVFKRGLMYLLGYKNIDCYTNSAAEKMLLQAESRCGFVRPDVKGIRRFYNRCKRGLMYYLGTTPPECRGDVDDVPEILKGMYR